LTIGGSVALWRPIEIYLYDWWPSRRRARRFDRLGRMGVELRLRANEPQGGGAGAFPHGGQRSFS